MESDAETALKVRASSEVATCSGTLVVIVTPADDAEVVGLVNESRSSMIFEQRSTCLALYQALLAGDWTEKLAKSLLCCS